MFEMGGNEGGACRAGCVASLDRSAAGSSALSRAPAAGPAFTGSGSTRLELPGYRQDLKRL